MSAEKKAEIAFKNKVPKENDRGFKARLDQKWLSSPEYKAIRAVREAAINAPN